MELNDRIDFLHTLHFELRNTRFTTIEAFNLYHQEVLKELKSKEELQVIQIQNSISELWNELREWVFGHIIYMFSVSSPFAEKITLAQWITNLAASFSDSFLNQLQVNISPPPTFQEIRIWSGPDMTYGQEFPNGFYWGSIYFWLHKWQKVTQTHLQAIEWGADSKTVTLAIQWEGRFQSIEWLKFGTQPEEFWSVIFQARYPLHLPIVSSRLLLNAQLIAQERANRLWPIEIEHIQHNQLTMTLTIPRADVSHVYPPTSQMPGNVYDQTNRDIDTQILAGYIEASKRLETALAIEIERLRPYALNGLLEEKMFRKLENAPHELVQYREKLIELFWP